ncbi:hypothetical protein HXX76_014149 [Chlamydomonas incerta]|uniref:RNA polymerase subunit H/Rpb5 C-terminal domain-containing protein n=1 Tax=Chlamydomonas incerta TaxID=51695 RepID=A0A835VTR3_CHLIN|nr:hypothetical protein HXX76_014149 [Chlamydomonas incerta]|eukprot:KAG2424991.1 hypothetical protein HXX76_014149 [Chlamydomonas incerta]
MVVEDDLVCADIPQARLLLLQAVRSVQASGQVVSLCATSPYCAYLVSPMYAVVVDPANATDMLGAVSPVVPGTRSMFPVFVNGSTAGTFNGVIHPLGRIAAPSNTNPDNPRLALPVLVGLLAAQKWQEAVIVLDGIVAVLQRYSPFHMNDRIVALLQTIMATTNQSIQDLVVRAFATIQEMLADRGEDASGLEGIGPPELERLANSQSIFTFEVHPSLLLIFYLTKMKVAEFKTAMFGKSKDIDVSTMDAYRDKRCMFVFKEDVTSVNRRSLAEFWTEDQIEVFNIRELQYNVSKHSLVPRHDKVPAEEVDSLLQRYNLRSRAQMPTIHVSDPMARYLGLRIGDVVKIQRPSQTAGHYYYYRAVTA